MEDIDNKILYDILQLASSMMKNQQYPNIAFAILFNIATTVCTQMKVNKHEGIKKIYNKIDEEFSLFLIHM